MAFTMGFWMVHSGAGIPRSIAGDKGTSPMARRIILCPIGNIELSVMEALEKELPAKFKLGIKTRDSIQIPEESFDPARGQHSSTLILGKLAGLVRLEEHDVALVIADVDLYAEGLNFVFGEAEFAGRFAIISLTRLRQSFYSLRENEALFKERVAKEAVHELGHVFGLGHCPDPRCVMHFSNSLFDTDKKSASFCTRCRALL